MLRSWILALLLCSSVIACGDDDGATTGGDGDAPVLSCPQSSPCVRAELGASANGGGTDYLDSVVCVLEALRDRGPGTAFQLEVGSNLDGDAPTLATFVVRGDGSALRQSTSGGTQGSPEERSDIEVCALSSSDFFRDCLDTPSLDCLDTDNWFSACEVDNSADCSAT